MKTFIYRWALIVAGVGWGVSVYTSIVGGPQVFEFLQFVSGTEFEYHPMLDYWMKLTGIAFTFIGAGFLFVGIRWRENIQFGRWFGWFQVICFLVVALTVLRIDLVSRIYLLDFLFFLATGVPILLTWRSAALDAAKDQG